MIIVDVFVPSIDRTYNCSIDDEATVLLIIRELVEMIEQRERIPFSGDRDDLALVSVADGRTLALESTPRRCGLSTGGKLMLV